ncbi:hypothetical protein OUZ56_015453 [Daphnia magna]|uniref:Uncharacterized protein n=1 Tax=Daphnia magna TaxID=35525 RepID=A0ABR0AMW6_9CRUS|nr:hypothetical protein OUZ56_015453 [Daphnia magna]
MLQRKKATVQHGAEVTIDIAQHHSLLISLSINWCDQSLDLARKKTSDRSIALDQSIARGNSADILTKLKGSCPNIKIQAFTPHEKSNESKQTTKQGLQKSDSIASSSLRTLLVGGEKIGHHCFDKPMA